MSYKTFHIKILRNLSVSHKLSITNSLWPFMGHFFNRSNFVFFFKEFLGEVDLISP